jgi:hypothetical protein
MGNQARPEVMAYPFDPRRTNIPYSGMSSDRSSIATNSDFLSHQTGLNTRFKLRMEIAGFDAIGGGNSPSLEWLSTSRGLTKRVCVSGVYVAYMTLSKIVPIYGHRKVDI